MYLLRLVALRLLYRLAYCVAFWLCQSFFFATVPSFESATTSLIETSGRFLEFNYSLRDWTLTCEHVWFAPTPPLCDHVLASSFYHRIHCVGRMRVYRVWCFVCLWVRPFRRVNYSCVLVHDHVFGHETIYAFPVATDHGARHSSRRS